MITSQNSYVSVIALPVTEWTWMAMQDVTLNMKESGFTDYFLPESFYRSVVIESIKDVIDDRSAWIEKPIRGIHLTKYLNDFDWFSFKDKFSGHLYGFIEDLVVSKIKIIVNEYIPENTYYIWRLREISPSDLFVLEKGDDYRIKEFYRLKERYEPNTKVIGSVNNIEVENVPNYIARNKDKSGNVVEKGYTHMKTNIVDKIQYYDKIIFDINMRNIKENKEDSKWLEH